MAEYCAQKSPFEIIVSSCSMAPCIPSKNQKLYLNSCINTILCSPQAHHITTYKSDDKISYKICLVEAVALFWSGKIRTESSPVKKRQKNWSSFIQLPISFNYFMGVFQRRPCDQFHMFSQETIVFFFISPLHLKIWQHYKDDAFIFSLLIWDTDW